MASLKYPGDYSLEKIRIITADSTLDLTEFWGEINFYEDLFSPGITVDVFLSDAINLPTYGPIIGEELLQIDFTTPDFKSVINLEFHLVELLNKSYIKERHQVYTIRGISKGSFNSLKTTISKSYKGKTHSEMAQDIFKQYVVPGETLSDVDQTRYTEDIVIPSMKPIEAIQWLAGRSVSTSGQSDYFFYETLKDGYKFKSLDTLLSAFNDEPSFEFNLSQAGLQTVLVNEDRVDVKAITQFNYQSSTNMKKSISRGMIASTLVSYNSENKEIVNTEFKYADDYHEKSHIGIHPFIYNRETSDIIDNPKNRILMTQEGDKTKSDVRVQKRISALETLNINRLKIEASGNIFLEVGKIVIVNIPSTEPIDQSHASTYDQHLSGGYIITALRHYISREKHTVVLDCAKESMGSVPLLGNRVAIGSEENPFSLNTFFE